MKLQCPLCFNTNQEQLATEKVIASASEAEERTTNLFFCRACQTTIMKHETTELEFKRSLAMRYPDPINPTADNSQN